MQKFIKSIAHFWDAELILIEPEGTVYWLWKLGPKLYSKQFFLMRGQECGKDRYEGKSNKSNLKGYHVRIKLHGEPRESHVLFANSTT